MRIRTLAIVIAVVALSWSLSAQAANPAAGIWKTNVAKSTYSPGPAPKSAMMKIVANADGSMTQTVDNVPATGAPVHYEVTFKFDGKDNTYKGTNPNADSASYKRTDDHHYEVTAKKGGKATVTTKVSISADGKTRTSTQTGTDAQGKAVKNTIVAERQ